MSILLPPAYLLDARVFSGIAALNGITRPERELIFTRELTPLQVGRRSYYDWREVLAIMPERHRKRQAKFAATVAESAKAGAR